jgi:hypothetical protein
MARPVAAKPPGVVKLPGSLRSRVDLEAPSREPVIAGRQHNPFGNLEWFKESFELRRVVELDVFARIQTVVDRSGEQTPAFGPALVDASEVVEEDFETFA